MSIFWLTYFLFQVVDWVGFCKIKLACHVSYVDDGLAESDSSREDVATETDTDVAIETTTMRRHDSLKAKKRAVLAALARKRHEASAEETLATDSRSVACLKQVSVQLLHCESRKNKIPNSCP